MVAAIQKADRGIRRSKLTERRHRRIKGRRLVDGSDIAVGRKL
jgi:hypothetical protein